MSVHRVADCLTQINIKRDSISSGLVLIPCNKLLTEKSFKKNYFSNTLTAELYIEQGNTDVTELMVIDEMTLCRTRCKMEVIFAHVEKL